MSILSVYFCQHCEASRFFVVDLTGFDAFLTASDALSGVFVHCKFVGCVVILQTFV